MGELGFQSSGDPSEAGPLPGLVVRRSVLFSEGIALYLWQIRHIPNPWRKLTSFSVLLAVSLMAVWAIGEGVRTARGQGDAKPATEKKEPKPADPATIKAATDFIKKLHESLYTRNSIKADVEQTASIGTQQFQIDGHYLSSGQKLRLEYAIRPDQGVAGSLLEICDGKDLWSLTTVGKTQRVTHRDVQQIKAAVTANRNVPDVVLTAELGLGGLTALLASLERTMIFDAMKEESGEDGARTIIQGRWKPEIVQRWPRGKDDMLPAYIPDLVRIWVDSKAMFPTRIVYIKRVIEKEKKVYRPLVSLKFKNVEFDAPVNDDQFTFEPPEGVVPEDITRQFLDRMKKGAEADAAKPAADQAKQ